MATQPAKAVLIAGPTASGKSALALRLAERLGGTIVNADSMQVYRDLRIITARPTPEEEARVPHRLYGHVDAAVNYSTGQWLRDVGEVLGELAREGRMAILVGGTGLYFKALTTGLAAVPPIPADIRARCAGAHERGRAAVVRRIARTRSADRASADAERPLAHFARAGSGAGDRALAHRLAPRRDAAADRCGERAEDVHHLRAQGAGRRIETRFAAMLQAGALEEVRASRRAQLDPLLPAMKAHGVPWLIRHLDGEIALDEAAAGAMMDTRRYAKRQLTWFRNQMKDWPWARRRRRKRRSKANWRARAQKDA